MRRAVAAARLFCKISLLLDIIRYGSYNVRRTNEGKGFILANRNRRDARAAQQAPRRPSARPRKKKKKVNWFRVVVVTLGLVLVAVVVFGIVRAAKPQVSGEDGGESSAAESQPEFFSTIRPDAGAASDGQSEESGAVQTSAFDGALFVGDSLTTQLKDYVEEGPGKSTALSDAQFLTASSYSWEDAAEELNGGDGSLYIGEQVVTLQKAIEETGARKLYIQLGKEDLIYNDVYTVTETAKTVLSALKTANPSLSITVQSVTPMLEWIDYQGLSSTSIAEYNTVMKTYCASAGMEFADVAAFFTDGYLPAEYCADPGQLCIHLNDMGCALWTSYLLGEISPQPTAAPTAEPDSGDTDGEDGREGAGGESDDSGE